MSSKSLKRTAEIVVLCVCAAVVWGCESDAQKYAGELKIRHAICMNKAGTFNASASVQCLCENTPDLRLSSAYVCSEGVRVSCDSAPQFCESNGAGEIGRLTYCSAGVWKTGYCECNANQNGCRECDETKDLPVCYSDNGQIVSRYCDNGEFKFDVCTKGCNVNGECNQECDPANAQTFCYDSDSTHEVRKCVNGVYKTMETCDLGCTNGKCNAECNTGEEKCENLAHYTCNDGMWEIKEYCPLGCDDKNKTCRNAACTDNVLCIMPENTVGYLFKCEEGKITENRTEVCKNDASCSSSNTCGECKNGEKKCVNGYTSVCVHGQLIPNKDEICDGRVCDDGVLYCRDNVLKECVDGKWKDTDCSLDGAFCDTTSKQCKKIECNLKDVKCAGEKSINKCGDDGQWNTTSCNNDGVCVHTDNGDECTECIPKTASCDGNTLKLCNPEGKLSEESCPSEKPFCVNKTCVECKGNDEKCEGNIHKQCENGEWKTELCAHGCDNNKCASQCVEHCDDNTPHVCSNNIAQKKCDEGKTCRVIDHKAICTECDPDDPNARSRCYPSNTGFDTSVGQYQVCENGMWSTPKTCTGDTRICAELGCGNVSQCKTGDKKCEDNVFIECVDGRWNEGTLCNDNESCDKDKGCVVCVEGQRRCNGNIIQVCNSGQWSSSGATNCEDNNLVCVDIAVGEADCKVCNLNVSECDFSIDTEDGVGYYKTCDNNYSWIMQQLCSLDVSVCKDNNQCVCHTGDAICVNNSLNIGIKSICGSSDSSSERQCDGQVSCKGNQCGECLNGTTQCENNEHNIGIVQTCKNGIWDPNEDDPCDDLSCNIDGTDCGECLNGSFKCDGNSPKKCNNGQWESFGVSCNVYGSSCMIINEGTVGEIAKCAFCKPGISQCVEDNKAYRVCNADGNWDDPKECTRGCDNTTGMCNCDARSLKVSTDGFRYNEKLISNPKLKFTLNGLMIEVDNCNGEMLLFSGDYSGDEFDGFVEIKMDEGVNNVTLCVPVITDVSSFYRYKNYTLTFANTDDGVHLNAKTCDHACVGNFCDETTCDCNGTAVHSMNTCCLHDTPMICENGDFVECKPGSVDINCKAICSDTCTDDSITVSDNQIQICKKGESIVYNSFTYECGSADGAVVMLSGTRGSFVGTGAEPPIMTLSLLSGTCDRMYDGLELSSTKVFTGSGRICAKKQSTMALPISESGLWFSFLEDQKIKIDGTCTD